MANFGQNFSAGFTEVQNLRDYTHASKTFTSNAYELKPKFKFLFHVSFTLNTQEIPALKGAFGNDDVVNLGLVVKTIDLPKFTVQTETLNQYNRKRVIQTKLNYDPVTVTFHDDSRDLVRKLWYNYFSYYYKDPSQQYLAPNNTNGTLGALASRVAGFGYNARDIYDKTRTGNINDWGFVGESYSDGTDSASGKPPFFRDIRIYGMDQHRTSEYVLINPLITNWSHDQYDYAQGGGIMQNTMTIAYETVKYYSGAIGSSRPDQNVQGFADPAHYDTRLSPISRAGSNSTVFGQGGLLDAGQGILQDLESGSVLGLIGAAQKASTAYNTFKGKNLKSMALSEATAIGQKVLVGELPGATRAVANKLDGWFFPTAKKTDNTTGDGQY